MQTKIRYHKRIQKLHSWWKENSQSKDDFSTTRIVVIKEFKEEWLEPLLEAATDNDIFIWADCLQSQYKILRRLVEDHNIETRFKAKAHILAVPLYAVNTVSELTLEELLNGVAFQASLTLDPISHNDAHRALANGDATAFMNWKQVRFLTNKGFLVSAHGYKHPSPETGGQHMSLLVAKEYILEDISNMRKGFESTRALGYLPEVIYTPYGISDILPSYYANHNFSWILTDRNTTPLHVIL